MIRKILNLLLIALIIAGSFVVPTGAEHELLTDEMVVVRDEDFEDYLQGIIANGAKYQPTSGEFKGMGVSNKAGDRYIRQNAVDGKGGVTVTLNTGITGNLVEVIGKDGEATQAIQILRQPKIKTTTATFGLQGESAFETSRLLYSFDVKNSGKAGAPGDKGYTREVNNCFGSMSILGITFDFNKKSVMVEGDAGAKPVVLPEEYKWVLPDNGTWFNVKLDIDAMTDTLKVFVDGKQICEKVYGKKFSLIESKSLNASMVSSGDGENAVYFDNLKVEKSSITSEELARVRAQSAFDTLGENAMVFYPNVSRVYFGNGIESFNEEGTLSPVKAENKIYLPIKYTAGKYGYNVSWEAQTSTIVLSGDKKISLKSGEAAFIEDGSEKTLKNPVFLLNGTSYMEISDAADVFEKAFYWGKTGLAMLVEDEKNLPRSDDDANAKTILNLFPEASLDFEVEGGWYTMDDLLEISGAPLKELQIGDRFDEENGQRKYDEVRYGMKRSTEHVMSGNYSGKWENHPKYPTIMATDVPKDWSKFNALSFWVYSEVATDERITVGAISNPNMTWQEYENLVDTVNFYHIGFDVDFTGWKKFVIPLSEFEKSSDLVQGFHKIDSLNFYSRALDYEPSPYTVLYFDDVRLETVESLELSEAVALWQNVKAEQQERKMGAKDYVLDVPEIFKDVNILDYSLLLEAKKTLQNGDGAELAKAQNEIDKIHEKYNITNDTYAYSDLVVNAVTNIVTDCVAPDTFRFNHDFPEVTTQIPAGEPLVESAYFRSGRANYGYDPKYMPGYVTVKDGMVYNIYATRMCQVADSTGTWHNYDWSYQIQHWAEEELGLTSFRLRDEGFYSEVHVRFDNDGDAYMIINLAGDKADGSGFFKAILCHSKDKMKTWDFYVLPRPFAKFEVLEGNNEECLERPPVILLHNWWTTKGQREGTFLIPEKQADGTLKIPEEIVYCEEPIMPQVAHSGKSNFCVTAGGKIFFTYGTLTASMGLPDGGLQLAKDRIPQGHQMWDLYKNELSDDTTSIGIPTYVRSYDLKTGEFSEPVYVGSAGAHHNDGHNWSAISVDNEGYLHVFIIGHHFPLLYVKSAKPYEIDEWDPIEVVSDGISYASINIDKEGNIYSATRNSNRGYQFDLCLQRKLKGGEWEELRIVKHWRSYYSVYGTDMYLDPETGRLYWQSRLKLSSNELFADGFAAHAFFFPDHSDFDDNRRAVGGGLSAVKQYASTGATPRGEATILISDDFGSTWRFALTEDLISK